MSNVEHPKTVLAEVTELFPSSSSAFFIARALLAESKSELFPIRLRVFNETGVFSLRMDSARVEMKADENLAHARTIEASGGRLEFATNRISARVAATSFAAADATSSLITTLQITRNDLVLALRSLTKSRGKRFESRSAEFDANAAALEHAARLCCSSLSEQDILYDAASALAPLAQDSPILPVSPLLSTPAFTVEGVPLPIEVVSGVSRIEWSIDGLGTRAARREGYNTVSVHRSASSAVALAREDVSLDITVNGASLLASYEVEVEKDGATLAYRLDVGRSEGVRKARLAVSLFATDIAAFDVQVCNVGFKGNAVETLALPEGISALPMCVDISADGTLLAICTDNNSEDEAIVVLTFPGLVKVRSFGSLTGDAARYIANPCVLAFAPSTNHILITEADNQRVQEFTVTGEHVRFIGEAPSTYDPTGSEPAPYGCIGGYCVGLAVNESVVVVGMWYDAANQIKVYDYASGNFVREFGPIGTNVSQLSSCFGIAFCGPNHSDVAIAEGDNGRVSVFSLDGAYVRTFGVGKVGRCLSVVSNPVGGFAIMPQSGHVTLFDDDCKVTGELSMLSADQESLPGSLFGNNGRLYTLGADSRSIVVYE